ncbi:MAG TPA: hypothetical protein VFW28_13780 [Micropepsaceae bacterium]|nr:hypothetical protein [Micropepsaceae bacterium]
MRIARGVAVLCTLPVAAAAQPANMPDFSGIWGRWLHFEPPATGPAPVTNLAHTAAGTMDDYRWAGDYTNPILKPAAAAIVKRRGDMAMSGSLAPNPHAQCRPEPTPYILAVEIGLEIVQRKDEVLLLYMSGHLVRHVRMNVPHPTHVTPSWTGNSIGHYDGDVLVIDTIGQKTGPLAMVDNYGTPYSESLHVVERYRLIAGKTSREIESRHERTYFPPGVPTNASSRGDIDPDSSKKGLQVEVTVEDPIMFRTPWRGIVTYRPALGEWAEAICAENPNAYYGSDAGIPFSEKSDF